MILVGNKRSGKCNMCGSRYHQMAKEMHTVSLAQIYNGPKVWSISKHEKSVEQAHPEGGNWGSLSRGPTSRGAPGTSSREAPFGFLSVLINLFPLCFK